MRIVPAFLFLAFLLAAPLSAGEAEPATEEDLAVEEEPSLDAAARAALAARLAPSLPLVEITLRTDKGEEPESWGFGSVCPNCGMSHRSDFGDYLTEERPVEACGYVLAPDRVLILDPGVPDRFVEKIEVVDGDRRVGARPIAYAEEGSAVLLATETKLKEAVALEFDASKEEPYVAVTADRMQGKWTINVNPASMEIKLVPGEAPRVVTTATNALVAAEDGTPVGIPMRFRMGLAGEWKGSPLAWPLVEAETLRRLEAKTRERVEAAVRRVKLGFRSPKRDERASARSDDGESTERSVPGLVVGPKRVLVLASLNAKTTARLERIEVVGPDGRAVPAVFEGTLEDYGGFVARLESKVEGAPDFFTGELEPVCMQLMIRAEVRIQGENRTVYVSRCRIPGVRIGWKRNLYPTMPARGQGPVFVFDRAGRLVAFPVARRDKFEGDRRWRSDSPRMTAAGQMAPVLAVGTEAYDASIVPLSEQEENRLAWMGVLTQQLDRDLARANQVSHLTRDGDTGALVSYVFPDSPAARAGIEPGWVLLRLHVEGHPKPIEIEADHDRRSEWQFPWDRLDDLPEHLYERIPAPWPPLENGLTRTITDLGFGKAYKAEVAHGGEVVMKEFTVEQSPPHYGTAAQFECEPLGLTVKNLTFEVRRYFQKGPEEPGLVVSKVEPGGRASVAGVKPFEVVTHINDRPIRTVDEFREAVKAGGELKLSVKRMMTGRVVKIQAEPAAESGEPSP